MARFSITIVTKDTASLQKILTLLPIIERKIGKNELIEINVIQQQEKTVS